jgi:hypothetical protein
MSHVLHCLEDKIKVTKIYHLKITWLVLRFVFLGYDITSQVNLMANVLKKHNAFLFKVLDIQRSIHLGS